MRIALIVLAVIGLAITAARPQAAGDSCNPLMHGAAGDGITDNAVAIQSAIDACAARGGGTVVLSVGNTGATYLTSPIRLKSHVLLQLDAGVTLLGSTDHTKYEIAYANYRYQPNEALVSANGAVETGIIGAGTIDGQGGVVAKGGGNSWWTETHPRGATVNGTSYYAAPYADIPTSNGVPRPWLVEFYECSNITVKGITLRNSPMWTLVFRYSTQVTVSDLTVTVAGSGLNTDGIDLVGASYVTMTNLRLQGGNDNISIKSGLPVNDRIPNDPKGIGLPQLPTHDVVIRNSTFTGGYGISIGSEAANGVYNVLVQNVTATDTAFGFRIKTGRARGNYATGTYNITLEDLNLHNVAAPLVINGYFPAPEGPVEPPFDPPQPITPTTPTVRDITISRLKATGATGKSFIVGLPESCAQRINFNDVNIETSTAGLQLRHMTGSFTNVNITPKTGGLAFVVQGNVVVTTSGSTPRITNTAARC